MHSLHTKPYALTVAIVGRPNVGKSTLFNRLTQSKDALVADMPGVTRDRVYGDMELSADKRVLLVDTGGLTAQVEGVETLMRQQAWQAIQEADWVMFLVSARDGLTAEDQRISKEMRKAGRKVILVINKIDGVSTEWIETEFQSFGWTDILPISSSHGLGLGQLKENLLIKCPVVSEDISDENETSDTPEDDRIAVAIIGRPNVGKSTLINRMLGEERVVVFDMPGTTRDSIFIPFERRGIAFTLIDTAGVRRRGRVDVGLEKFSVIKTLSAIRAASAVVLVIDAQEGLVDQDLHLLGFAIETGRSIVIAVNKWDGLDPDQKEIIKQQLDRKLNFVRNVKILNISALHGTGVGLVFDAVVKAHKSALVDASPSKLSAWLEEAVAAHNPPAVHGRRIKLRYAHIGGRNPLQIVIHGNQTQALPTAYKTYLSNFFQDRLKLVGTPVQLIFKTGDNPFAGKKNKLTKRQVAKKKRLMKHVRN